MQKTLSQALGLNNSAVTGLVGRMLKNNIIERKACTEDGRASRLFLTKEGQDKLPIIYPLIQELNEKLSEEFSQDELETVSRFLSKVIDIFK